MKQYLDMLQYILDNGEQESNRTGIDTIMVSGYKFEHDMKDGFPLLTSKKMGIKSISAELEMFIKGIQSKKFLQDRKCHIWDEWASGTKVPYGNDPETKAKMAAEDDLGPIYGVQGRRFDDHPELGLKGTDQLKNLIDTIKKDPTSRRLLVSYWNPNQIPEMALPPCHFAYQVLCHPKTKKMDIIWYQRSCDAPLGIPYDLASYALLLTLLCKETGYEPGKVIGMFANLHIYVNQIEGVKEQLKRPTHKLPTLEIKNFTSIFDWKYDDIELKDYEHEDAIKFDIAV